jgi:glycosyltransferase involved in cell wall biosynthesis
MRIAVNTRFLLAGKLEGMGWYTYELCRAMVRMHPSDTFYFLFDRPYSREFIFSKNCIPLVVPPPARHPWLWELWFEYTLPVALKAVRAEVFFSPDGYLSLRSRVPTLMTLHDLAFLHYPEQVPPMVLRYYQRHVPRFLERANAVAVISHFVKEDVAAHFPAWADKLSVVPNGPRKGFHPLSEAEKVAVRQQYAGGKPYFFYLGALHPRKNLPRLIRAFTQFKAQTNAPLELLIGGRMAWQTGDIQAAWQQSPYRDAIRFLGYVPEDTLRDLLAAAYGLAYFSLFEGFGLPVLEAFSCDVPVLASNTSSIPEVAGAGALLADPTREGEMADVMRILWEEPGTAEALIGRGREQLGKFSWESAAEKIYELLVQTANEGKG